VFLIAPALTDRRPPPLLLQRGGAWVVLDPTINDAQMEMYADEESRGGIMEPEGIAEIKYRRDKILANMERLDETYARLKAESKDESRSAEERAKSGELLKARETALYPTFLQIAHHYVDLHDRVGRMEAKGCAKRAVWSEARRFFYWRLRRRLNEENVLARYATANPDLSLQDRRNLLVNLVQCDPSSNRQVAEWIEQNQAAIGAAMADVRSAYVSTKIVKFAETEKDGALKGLLAVLSTLSAEDKQALISNLGLTGGQ
jgi:acetyl-CoA carboxylase/biotin carboxylase 1